MENPTIGVTSEPGTTTPGQSATPQTTQASAQSAGANGSSPQQDASGEGGESPDTFSPDEKYEKYVELFFPDYVKNKKANGTAQAQQLQQAALSPEDIDRIVQERVNARLAQQAPAQPATTQQQINSLPPEEKAEFLTLLKNGDNKRAEEVLNRNLVESMTPGVLAQVQQNVMSRMMAFQHATTTIKEFESDFYSPSKNQDLIPWKGTIDLQAKEMVNRMYTDGQIKDVNDYLDAHKTAIQLATKDLRNKLASLRGEGKQEAMTRQQQVLATQTITPGQVGARPGESAPNSTQPLNAQDYITARKQRQAQMTRMVSVSPGL